jgi:hypothetical protein
MRDSPRPTQPVSRWRERLGWLVPIALAVITVCAGCFMLFAFALTSRGELQTSALGSDWRVWQLQASGTNGVGISQSTAFTSSAGQSCRHTLTWLITWRPELLIDAHAYDDCGASNVDRSPVAHMRHSDIIVLGGRI